MASDRTPGKDKIISDFFADFLGVHERETPSALTKKTISAVRRWAMDNLQELGDDVSGYKGRCIEYLKNTNKVDSDDLIRSVVQEGSSGRTKKYRKSLQEYLENEGLYGQKYKPAPSVISSAITNNIRKTAEGVRIQWEGEAKDMNIEIPNAPDPNDGLFHIVIRTESIEVIK